MGEARRAHTIKCATINVAIVGCLNGTTGLLTCASVSCAPAACVRAGLRWWNRIKEDGSNEWIFESR